MDKIKLTKREYLGEGYYDVFSNNGELKEVQINKETYENSDRTQEDLESGWVSSYKTDYNTDTGGLKENEFIVVNGLYIARLPVGEGMSTFFEYSKEEFDSKYIWQ